MNEETYEKIYPTGAGIPKFYGLPKIHQGWSTTKTYCLQQGVSILCNSKVIDQDLETIGRKNNLEWSEHKGLCWTTQKHQTTTRWMHHIIWCKGTIYISAHRTCNKDHPTTSRRWWRTSPQQRTSMSVQHIIWLYEFCLKNTYFIFSRQVLWTDWRSIHGLPNKPHHSQPLYGGLWKTSHQHSTTSPSLCRRFVDDTFIIIKKAQKNSFINHINSIDEKIQFTMEDGRSDASMPFLDTLVTPSSDSSLSPKVYRKPTHTDLYMQWNNHHTIAAKYSVVNTLHPRAKAVCFKTKSYWKIKKNTYKRSWLKTSTPHGP